MSEHNPRPLAELIDPGWAKALAPVEGRIHELGTMLAAEVEEGHGYLPAGTDVLRAFTYPFDKVKVLIVGQDPYPTPGHAMGLSFSVHPGVALPKSLINIFRELSEDMGVPAPTSGDLTPWSEQGVCLLNRVLTVRPGAPASHRGRGWEEVTQCAIDALVSRTRPDGSRVFRFEAVFARESAAGGAGRVGRGLVAGRFSLTRPGYLTRTGEVGCGCGAAVRDSLEPAIGLEPMTCCLQDSCSTN